MRYISHRRMIEPDAIAIPVSVIDHGIMQPPGITHDRDRAIPQRIQLIEAAVAPPATASG